jgi:lysozyme
MAAQVNNDGLNLIKQFEGLSLDSYQDAVGIWTIGYGHTGNVQHGQTISNAQADGLLEGDVTSTAAGVARLLKVPVSDNQFSAMVSLAYNIGLGNFAQSTVLKQVNAGNAIAAADAFELWNKGHVDGQLVILPGLSSRRSAEKALFLKPEGPAGESSAIEQNTRLPPGPERGNQRTNLSDSRTMQGSAVAGGAGAVAAAGAASQSATAEHPSGAATATAPTPSGSNTGSAPPTTTGAAAPPATSPGAATAQQPLPSIVQRTSQLFHDYPEIYLVAAVLILLSIALIIFARVDDWVSGKR